MKKILMKKIFTKRILVKREKRIKPALALCVALIATLPAGCATNPPATPQQQQTLPAGQETPSPTLGGASGTARPIDAGVKLPAKLGKGENGEPTLKVYIQSEKKVRAMDLETYLQGVLAGEMKNDWPLEALKAQAILARTFVLKFLAEKQSKYPGADISTDIEEAQAYDAAGVNDRIRMAVSQTKGLALIANGDLAFGWFHAHSGGLTAKAKEGLEYEKAEPSYTKIVQGRESGKAPEDVATWTASFSAADVLKAAGKLGASATKLTDIHVGQRGESGRAVTLIINGASVPAASFRIALGSTEMKSTLLESIKVADGRLTIQGKGYGHGVGMSQWGAYGLAEQGEQAEDIVRYYFNGAQVVRLW
jgi:stage II sporulation protein D